MTINYQPYIDMAQAMANIAFHGTYLIHPKQRKVVYASETLLQQTGLDGVDSPEALIALSDRELDAVDYALEIYKAAAPEKRKGLVLYINTHKRRQAMAFTHKLSIVAVDSDDNPVLVFGCVSPSIRDSADSIIIRFSDEDAIYRYQPFDRQWLREPLPHLTDNELTMLRLTLQGHSLNAIGQLMCKSTESVKYYRRQVFEKFGARNITEALAIAADYCLL